MAAWRFTICCHPKSRWPPSEHMHQSPEIRGWRNTAEVSRRGITNPEAGNRQVTRKKRARWTISHPTEHPAKVMGDNSGGTEGGCNAPLSRSGFHINAALCLTADTGFPSPPSFAVLCFPLPFPLPSIEYRLFPVSTLSGHGTVLFIDLSRF